MHPRPPVSLTSLVGREREIHDLTALIGARRLVTLTGVGGSGKTRLAAEIALRLDWQGAAGVAWLELGSCAENRGVLHRTCSALGLTTPTLDALVAALDDRDLLLVLDDCEHVISGTAELARTLLLRCPKLRILATSREPLGVAGEHVWPIPPIAPQEALQLFAERAAAVDPSFAITGANASVLTEICQKLDGIPLAIELAAARIRVLTPEQINAKLEDRFAILTGGARTTLPRHRTLRAAIDWSIALLNDEERTLLARLSIFSGTFSLEAAEAVCEASLDLMTGLVDKSLVVTQNRRGAIRYHLLETIKQYAFEMLTDADALRRRHALVFAAMARDAVVDPMGAVMPRLEFLDAEHDNVRAALAWSLEHEPDTIAMPLAASFRWYWYFRILWSEGLRWLTPVLERASSGVSADRAAVLTAAGSFSSYTGDLANGRRLLAEAEAMWRAIGDQRELALTLSALAQLLGNAGELEEAASRAAEAVMLARTHGTPFDVAYCLANALAFIAERRDELDDADRALDEAEALCRPSENPLGLPFVLSRRALLAVRRGDLAAAAQFARDALIESRKHRYQWFCARALRVLAIASTNDLPRAARLLGAAGAMHRAIGARMLVHEIEAHEKLMATLRAASLDDALHEGGAMTFDEACEFALQTSLHDERPQLHVADLGPLQIALGGQPLANDGRASQRARELLVFLAAHPHGPTKEEVGVAFWPDATTEQVKNSFHVTLHRLRKLLGSSESVVAEGGRYRITLPHVVDSRRFETSMTAALRSNDAASLESAIALYDGDFLQGDDAGEWCLPVRARLRQLHVRGLVALGQAYESRGRYTDAAETYTRVLGRDPFHESAARQLMICHSRLGARSESLLIYRQLEQRLRDDLQASPEAETALLYRRLRQNEAV